MNNSEKRRILILLSGLVIMMLSLVVYLTYFQFLHGDEYKYAAGNRRNSIEPENIIRGSFYDSNGEIIAYSDKNEDGIKTRHYPMGSLYSHIVGYTDPSLGKSGLELHQNDYLTNNYNMPIPKMIKGFIDGNDLGANIHLSIDTKAQQMASDLLGESSGSIVAMDPNSGRIIAMVSKPDFDPGTIASQWASINESEDSPLFNRSINGQYPPGSVFKIVSTAAILEAGTDEDYKHTGTQIIDGYEYKDATSRIYGNVGLNTAFSQSLNTYYVDKIQDVGIDRFKSISERFGFGDKLEFPLPVSISNLNMGDNPDPNLLSASSIGQGRVLSTPLEMAMVTSAIANEGNIMNPILIDRITDYKGDTVHKYEPSIYSEAISPEIADRIKDLMIDVTRNGTGTRASISGVQVAGKTGTAENATGASHAWYTGFAPANDPEIVVAVIVEGGNSGGTVAAPIAREMINYVLKNKQ